MYLARAGFVVRRRRSSIRTTSNVLSAPEGIGTGETMATTHPWRRNYGRWRDCEVESWNRSMECSSTSTHQQRLLQTLAIQQRQRCDWMGLAQMILMLMSIVQLCFATTVFTHGLARTDPMFSRVLVKSAGRACRRACTPSILMDSLYFCILFFSLSVVQ